jgi:hypothetical protein
MPRTKQSSKRRRQTEVVPVLGVVGASLALAGGASAATGGQVLEASSNLTSNPQLALSEEEISDVTLASFYVFDKENAGAPRLGERLAWRGCGGCRGCRACRGCRGCRGCGGCGCGGCSCCWSWGFCRVC